MIRTIIWLLTIWFNLHSSLVLIKPNAKIIEHGVRSAKVVALTFDACMTPRMQDELEKGAVPSWYNEKVVNILRKNNVPATFFVSGLWAKSYPDVVKGWAGELVADGIQKGQHQFEIENHSWDHAAMHVPCYGLGLSADKQAEITLTQKILTDLTGRAPRYFRYPGGCYGPDDLKLVANAGMQSVDWDVVSGDAFLKDAGKIENEVLRQTKNGSIVIMHVVGGRTAPATGEALQGIIDGLKKKGFSFVKVEDLKL